MVVFFLLLLSIIVSFIAFKHLSYCFTLGRSNSIDTHLLTCLDNIFLYRLMSVPGLGLGYRIGRTEQKKLLLSALSHALFYDHAVLYALRLLRHDVSDLLVICIWVGVQGGAGLGIIHN